jgi:hypothetical protein
MWQVGQTLQYAVLWDCQHSQSFNGMTVSDCYALDALSFLAALPLFHN